VITDGSGSFTCIISVLNQTDGIYTIRAVDETGNEANATFTVILDSQTTPQDVDSENVSQGISILSPENRTYNTADIPLAYTKTETYEHVTCSLDGQPDIDPESTSLNGLTDGTHKLTVYANYTDSSIGNSTTVWFTVDTTPPNITDVIQAPVATNETSEAEVSVSATVTDAISGVKRVTLSYTDGNGTWTTTEMTKQEGNLWNGTIPAFPHGTTITYTIMAEDTAGNTVTTEELYGEPNQYEVLPEFPLWVIVPLFFAATAFAIVARKRLSSPAFVKVYNSIHKVLTYKL
jgi:hypothetical protein